MNKKLLTVSLAMASICVAGCSTTPIESDSTEVSISSTETTVDITNADLPKGVTTYTAEDGTTHNLNRAEIFKAAGSPHVDSCPENGKKQKLLVNPIRFQKDASDSQDTIVADDALLQKITKTFTASDAELKQLAGADIGDVDVSILNDAIHGCPEVVNLGPTRIHVVVHGTALADGFVSVI